MDFYTSACQRLAVGIGKHPNAPTLPRPLRLEEMERVSLALAGPLDFARIDLYELEDGGVVFGEVTFYPHGCSKKWRPAAFDAVVGATCHVDYGPCASRRLPRPLDLTSFLATGAMAEGGHRLQEGLS